MSAAKDIAVVLLPVVATQIGEGVREALKARREAPCAHGRPGGRLCPTCSPCGVKGAT